MPLVRPLRPLKICRLAFRIAFPNTLVIHKLALISEQQEEQEQEQAHHQVRFLGDVSSYYFLPSVHFYTQANTYISGT